MSALQVFAILCGIVLAVMIVPILWLTLQQLLVNGAITREWSKARNES